MYLTTSNKIYRFCRSFLYLSIYFLSWIPVGAIPGNKIDSLVTELDNTMQDSIRIRLMIEISKLSWLENPEKSFEYAQKVLNTANVRQYPEEVAIAHINIGGYYKDFKYEYKKALDSYRKALGLFQKQKDSSNVARTYSLIGSSYSNLHDTINAHFFFEKALSLYRTLDDWNGISLVQSNMAAAYCKLFDYKKALTYYLESLKNVMKTENKEGMAITLGNISTVYFQMGNHVKSIEYQMKASEVFEELNNYRALAVTYNNTACTYFTEERYDKALEYFQKSLGIKKQLFDSVGMANSIMNMAGTQIKLKNYDDALDLCNEAYFLYKEFNNQMRMAHLLNDVGEILEKKGNYKQAIDTLKRSIAISSQIDDKENMSRCYYNAGGIYHLLKDDESAITCYQRSLNMAKEINNLELCGNIYLDLSKLHSEKGEYDKAYHYNTLHTLFKDSVYSLEKSQAIAEIQEKFDAQEKERTLRKLSEIIQSYHIQSRNSIYLYSGLAALICVFILLFMNGRFINRSIIKSGEEAKEELHFLSLTRHYPVTVPSVRSLIILSVYVASVLFFLQPFTLNLIEDRKWICFLLCTVVAVVWLILNNRILPSGFKAMFHERNWNILKEYLFIFWNVISLGSSVILIVWLMGSYDLSTSNVIINLLFGFTIAFIPVSVNTYRIHNEHINNEYERLSIEFNQKVPAYVQQTESNPENEDPICFVSAITNDEIMVPRDKLLYVKSDNVYVDFFYKSNASTKNIGLRETLTHVEDKLKEFPEFIRCHRSYIVNINKVKSIKSRKYKYSLFFKTTDKPVPVSRSCIKKVLGLLAQTN